MTLQDLYRVTTFTMRVEIFNEQKQTIKVLEDTITDLKLKNNELKNSYDLSVEENKKLKLHKKQVKFQKILPI